jgi:hypothetical protein
MLRSTPIVAALLCLVFARASAAQLVSVPEDYSDLQAALDGVSANATIVVHGGQWLPIVIDKPVTIIGDPQPLIMPDGPPPTAASPVTLAGPGSGVVRLVNLQLGGGVDGGFYSACDPSIAGGGFAALHVFDSLVEGAPWQFEYNIVYPGADAIRVDVPFVWIERCTVRGADSVADGHNTYAGAFDAGDAIVAPGTVVLLDSSVRGGDGPSLPWDAGGLGGCAPTCPGGSGGDGVVSAQLVRANSSIEAGSGTQWLDELGVDFCCQGPAGLALDVGTVTSLADDLTSSGPALAGAPYTLAWTAPGPAVLLFVSPGVGPAPHFGAARLFLEGPLFLGLLLPSPSQLTTHIPGSPAYSGLEFAVQLYTTQGWSRPVAAVIAP